MAQRVFLHIGAPKAGRTYVQSLLWANRAALSDDGLLVPGRALFDHTLASIAVRGNHDEPELRRRAADTWERLVNRARGADGDVVLSNEWYCWADADRARLAVEAFAPAEVHLVFTARPIAQQVFVMLGPQADSGLRRNRPAGAHGVSRSPHHFALVLPPTIRSQVPDGTLIHSFAFESVLDCPAQAWPLAAQSFLPALATPKHFSVFASSAA